MKKLKTYSEAKNKQPFDWNKALSVDCKDMSKSDVNKMLNRAKSWVTCACGNQCDVIKREKGGEPTNGTLSQLGQSFYSDGILLMAKHTYPNLYSDGWITPSVSIANIYRRDAIKILRKIEKLSSKLIQEQKTESINTLLKLGYKITKK